jgi:predicted amidohydrolase
MKICVAQTRPVKGDIQKNIVHHKKLIHLALANGADTIIFPELSITSYEPELARDLATDLGDSRFDTFQKISDINQVTIGIGSPTKSDSGTCISMILFQPGQKRQLYSKQYLHPDEEPFFVSGQNNITLVGNNANTAIAICYEISVPAHAEAAFKNGAQIYIASVAKTAIGVEKAMERLSEIGNKYSMTVLMSNCIGECGGMECTGSTTVWNNKGLLKAQLNDTDEGILIYDTDTQEVIEKTIT